MKNYINKCVENKYSSSSNKLIEVKELFEFTMNGKMFKFTITNSKKTTL